MDSKPFNHLGMFPRKLNKETGSFEGTLHCKIIKFYGSEKSEASVGPVWSAGQTRSEKVAFWLLYHRTNES
jgi:hypothetical protein